MNRSKIAFAIMSLLGIAGCGTGGSDIGATTQAPVIVKEAAKPTVALNVDFNNVDDIAVHDPSVIKDGEHYYIFGSHLAAAKSTDLINWEYISVLEGNATVDGSPLFDTYTSEIAEGIEWTDGFTGNWAANVIKAPNGKYWFYYNHCAQDNPDTTDVVDEVCWNRSYLGLAEADNIEGPYIDKGVFLRSGYRSTQEAVLDSNGNTIPVLDDAGNAVVDGEGNAVVEMTSVFPEFAQYPLDNGQVTWAGHVDPNAIDPTAFYDKEGKLWMVYGSYSGGIFVLALDETTGKPEAGQGYGKHLVGGSFRAMEGAFAFYSPESEYYYLMWSVAGFAANEGYNIRMARAKNPEGPYYDPAGNDIASGEGLAVGAKLMGGFEYTQEIGETAPAWGYLAPGHNSAYFDEATGRHLLVTHTRFPLNSSKFPENPEAHQVRTHEMFVNKDGWLVASPQRYVPLAGDNVVAVDDVMGYYKFINHGVEVNTVANKSGHIALNEDHSVTGSDPGVWFMLDPQNISLELASGRYVGTVQWQWDDGRDQLVPTFSLLAKDGSTVWGSQVNPIDATGTTLSDIQTALVIPSELTVADVDFTLPTQAKDGATINWQSSDEYYISNTGSVFIPTPDRGDKTITLDATISLNGQMVNKSFTVTLKARPEFKNAIAHYKFENNVSSSLTGVADATVTTANMQVAGGTEAYTAGQTGNAFSLDGATGVKIPSDLVKSDAYTIAFWSNPTELAVHSPAIFLSPVDNFDRWMTLAPENVWFTSSTTLWSRYLADDGADLWNQIVTSSNAAYNDWTHYTLSYGEGVLKLYINGTLAGSMPRPDFFSATGGDIALGTGYGWDPSYKGLVDELIVYDYELSSLDINGAAVNNLTDPTQFTGFIKDALDLGDLSAVKSSFELPRVGPFVSGISWSADANDYFVIKNGQAIVTQPAPAEGDQQITLTATINYKGFVETKTFDVIVKSLAPAEYSFEGDLSAFDAVAAAGKVTGDRIGNTGGNISFTDGVVGQALNLDGTSGVRLPDNLITSEQYSISVWLKPTVITDYTTALFGASDSSRWISFVPQINNDSAGPLNSSTIWASNGAWWNDFNFGEKVIPANSWTHLVVTVDGTNAKVYLNGEPKLSSTDFPNLFSLGLTTEWGIGVNYWDTPYNGAVDELKFFYETIPADKVTELYSELAQ
ncbi:LamG-like jellyroll fold domain-containing protein [Algibacillus agarilyticus]|uniref:LamG-like jellyroll fold domain-containing protein n=1 Tax=Algibacillus agarilyticus TaxID=2234133 RepID=UPI000DD03172|nr:LamG-like jellyroll fold domain-containing protein [Algibacillus agarilyticus]